MRILSVRQLKSIQVDEQSFVYPLSSKTKINLDKRSPSGSKQHQVKYQQASSYGSVGDCCTYLSNKQLFELQDKGMISIKTTKSKVQTTLA